MSPAPGEPQDPRLESILRSILEDPGRHLLRRDSPEELARVEEHLGRRLRPELRTLLEVCGAGILYDQHELFGASPLMIHDIELVPDLVSMWRRVRTQPSPVPDHLLPFHRAGGAIHAIDLDSGAVRGLTGQEKYADLADFLTAVVLSGS